MIKKNGSLLKIKLIGLVNDGLLTALLPNQLLPNIKEAILGPVE